MRILLILAAVAIVRGASLSKTGKRNNVPWNEWGEDLGAPDVSPTKPPSVCVVPSEDGSVTEVCCVGYTGRVEDRCPTPICNSPCLNGGTCTAPNQCTCTPAYNGDTCADFNRKEYIWSRWIHVGNSEQINSIKDQVDMCKNTVPEAIECQTESGVDHSMRGQVLRCDRRRGFECNNDDQPSGDDCDNYIVRLLCPKSSKKNTGTCIRKGAEYNAGELIKEDDCMECECSSTGAWDCYEDYCGPPIPTTPAPRIIWRPPGVEIGECMVGETVFRPGETTTLDCKMCTCDRIRGWQCIDSEDPTCLAPPEDDYCRIDDRFIIFYGQTVKKDCNTCICKNREWECTQTICPDKNRKPASSQCVHPETDEHHEDGDIVKRDCNICVCTQSKWDCTRDKCREGTLGDSDASLARRQVCTTPTGLPYPHGATISQDCNACKCFDGKWQCTRRFCSPETYPVSTCLDEVTASLVQSGKTIRRGCDVCLCNGGNLTCTSKPCSTNTGPCFDEQRRFTTTSTAFDKQYRPSCRLDGTFNPIQCNPLHSICFCVTSLGHVIPHTAVKQDAATPNCAPHMISHNPLHYTMPIPETPSVNNPCVQRHADNTSRLTGYLVPQCLLSGYFAPMQCDPHTGICYCVSPDGTTIPGTIMHVSQGRPNCHVLREETPASIPEEQTPCQREREKAEMYKLPFKPDCDDFGRYRPLQINPHSKVDFCVDRNGMVLETTIKKTSEIGCNIYANYVREEVKPYTSRVDERRPYIINTFPVKDLIHKVPRCILQQRISEQVPTVYRPSCEIDGRYEPMQCPSGTSVCFCVDVTGAIVAETTRNRGQRTELNQCSEYRSVFDVITPSNTSTVVFHPPVSLYHTGWDTRLREIEHDSHRVGPQYSYTQKPVVFKTSVTACMRQQQIASVVPGVFRPSCQHDGTFSTYQHEPLTYEVYCVDTNGVKIEGTETRMSRRQPLPECTQYWSTTIDMQKVSRHWSSESDNAIALDNLFPAGLHQHPNCTRQQELTSRIEGTVVPTCDPTGTYTPLQCNATTGVCYCILPYGDILPVTVTPMVKGTPSCWHLKNVATPVAQVCKQPVVTGPCKARLIQWAFSKLLNKCTMFVYGGCGGNLNRFDTEEECKTTCGSLTPPRDVGPLTCERKLARFNRMSFVKRISMRRPSCSPDGNYKTKQCKLGYTEEGRIEKVCECVDRMTGERLDRCPEEEMVSESERIVEPTAMSTTTKIDGCLSEGVLYHEGDSFFKKCNNCTCIGNNKATCTNHYCYAGWCYHDGQRKHTYERGCERCSCIGGHWDCQPKPSCAPSEMHTPVSGSATGCVKVDGSRMNVGAYYYDSCNKCTCDSEGHVHCENNYCIPRHCYHEGVPFHEAEVVMQDCNKCVCFSGHWDCQTYVCDPFMRSKIRLEGCEYKGAMYNDGDTFHDKCKRCECLGNNITACDKDSCNPSSCFYEGEEIQSGWVREVDCNTCTCYNGLLDCTQNTCSNPSVPIQQAARPPDTSITCSVDGKRYTNGQEFWKDCKLCRCYDNGEAICEEKLCVSNLCYEEGVGYRGGEVLFTETHECTCFSGGLWHCRDKPEDTGPPDYIECPLNSPTVACFNDPCANTICPAQPDAVCVPDQCGKCQPAFFDDFGNRLRC